MRGLRFFRVGTDLPAPGFHKPEGSMYPNSNILWPQSVYVGSTLRPKYVLLGYVDP